MSVTICELALIQFGEKLIVMSVVLVKKETIQRKICREKDGKFVVVVFFVCLAPVVWQHCLATLIFDVNKRTFTQLIMNATFFLFFLMSTQRTANRLRNIKAKRRKRKDKEKEREKEICQPNS